ncbi:MAG: M15 family metallopeptidase [Cyanobacteria bacterium P01_D01_bin.73]
MDDPSASPGTESDSQDVGAGRLPSKDSASQRLRLSTDVPEAVRDTGSQTASRKNKRGNVTWLLALIAVIAVAATFVWGWSTGQLNAWLSGGFSPGGDPVVEEVVTPNTSPTVSAEDLLGHLPYEEAPEDDLVAISADGRFMLRSSAAEGFQAMTDAARREGISLSMISAFRSIAQQQQIFFDVKANRRQTPDERAEVSAPPGYSEHHTGYAIDIGDAGVPSVNLSESFEGTRAFEWLDRNAVRFNFELSFPRDNVQGIAYEPWHWRFVGDRHSLETFYKARYQVKPRPTPTVEDADGTDEAED